MPYITINKRVLQKLIPIAIGYIALGIACGILAQQSGLSPLEAFGMSVLVFAGSGQFIGIAMLAQGAALVSIGLTIFIVNLRHLLFSSTLMNFFNGRGKGFLCTYAHGITDETFAVNLNAFEGETNPPWSCEEALGLNMTSCAVWSLSNGLGCYAAAYLNPPTELVSYLLIAMFLGIWVNYLTDRKMVITGLVSGLLALLLSQIVPYKLHIVLATLAASGAACYITERHAGGDSHVR
ncbi:AzlC family ABC transporter permease [Phascolarctobacterium sp.]|mgnify:FL=1|uniref:AzlC family ABC transporter permease n=1 Tax=Phascolarctobacterium sp. TaxID=2049039 RepID=UPI0015AFC20A|nr:AzlC family ABC transporter permease [uncultured Phascolarctobacterium sp.]